MKLADISDCCEDMAGAGKAVFKRTSRVFVEDGIEKEASEHHKKKSTVNTNERDTGGDAVKNMASTTSLIGPASAAVDGATAQGGIANGNCHRSSATTATTDKALLDLSGPSSGLNSQDGVESIELATRVQDSSSLVESEHVHVDGRPHNFGVVLPGIFRSSYPQTHDYDFLERLKLKTVVTLVDKELPAGYKSFLNKNGIKHRVFDMPGTKKESIPIENMSAILGIVLDPRNHPLLIHCNHGRHRTGCVVGIIRKAGGWQLPQIINEYKFYAEPKIRDCDLEYIAAFDPLNLAAMWTAPQPWMLISQRRFRHFCRVTVPTVSMILLIWLVTSSQMILQTANPSS